MMVSIIKVKMANQTHLVLCGKSSKVKITADQKEHKTLCHIYQKQLDSRIFCGLIRQKQNFLKGLHPVTPDVKGSTAFHKENIIPTVKRSGGSVMV